MPNFGPDADFAMRIRRIEDWISRQSQNPIGQAISATQSDGSVGWQVYQDPSTGATAMVFRQGPATSRDPSTNQHPSFVYIGELFSGGTLEDAGALFYRPTGTQSGVIGNRGVQVLDPAGHPVLTTDEYGASPSGVGLNSPWLPLGQPVTSSPTNTGWPNTTSTSMTSVAFLTFPAQHAQITWYGTAYCPSGTTGSVQVTVNNGAAGAAHAVGAGFTNLSETFSLGTWSWQQVLQIAVNAEVTSGAGPIYIQVYGVWGCGSGF